MNNVIPPTVSNAEIVIKKGPNPLYIRMMAVRTQIKMTRYLICQLERTRAFRKALAQKDENKMIDIIDKAFEDAHKGKDFFWFKKIYNQNKKKTHTYTSLMIISVHKKCQLKVNLINI